MTGEPRLWKKRERKIKAEVSLSDLERCTASGRLQSEHRGWLPLPTVLQSGTALKTLRISLTTGGSTDTNEIRML
jgi:hypothetical protein